MLKKKISSILLILIPFLLGVLLYYNSPKTIEAEAKQIQIEEKVQEEPNYEEIINNLKSTYNNQDIIGIVQIPNILEEIVLQTNNNDYYLKHDIYHNYNINGAAFLDYRNNLRDSKKLLIYGHSDPYGELPFVKITNFNNEKFLKDNPYIYLIDKEGKRQYEVFSSYIETKDFDYVNLESFGGLTYKEHLEKLKKKSFVNKKIELDDNSKVLILQTCSFDERVNSKTKFQIVIAKEMINE